MNKIHHISRIWSKINLPAFLLALVLVASSCSLPGSTISNASASAWVEYPYEGSTLPMIPTTLTAYAADPAGISAIHISLNGQTLPDSALLPLSSDGSSRLARVDQYWIPTEEGQYQVKAIGVNTQGGSGSSSLVNFCIVTCNPGSEQATPTSTPTPAPLGTDTPAPNITDTATPESAFTSTNTPGTPSNFVDVTFVAGPPSVNAGECSTLRWQVTGTATAYLDGVLVTASGTKEVCPCTSETHNLRAVRPDGTFQDTWATVSVSGSCSAPPPPPPSDTTGPAVEAVYLLWEGCTAYGQSTISDPSGVIWAEFWYNLNDQGWSWIKMNEMGGYWESQVGISVSDGFDTPVGNITFKVRTEDSYNNESWSSVYSHDYNGCGY